MEKVLRTMGPHTIAVDEITSARDCAAMLHVAWCGVKLLATAHASCREDLMARPVYKPLVKSHLFDTLVILRSDKSWKAERMEL
jgi:stage III sporulation protein AA